MRVFYRVFHQGYFGASIVITLYLGRHGSTRLNSEDKLRGWKDVPLDSAGIKEANAMGDRMAKTDIDRIYASDLDRADHTAQIVAEHHDLKPILRSWFRPIHFGELNGKSLKDIGPELDRITKTWETNPQYEVPGGESFSEFQNRNLQGLHAILKAANDGEQIMLVAHLRNAILFHAVATTGGPLSGDEISAMDGKEWEQAPGSVSQFEFDENSGKLKYVGMFFDPKESEEKAGMS